MSRIILVTGATSQVGTLLLPLLAAGGHRVLATSRRTVAGSPATVGVTWQVIDLQTVSDLPPLLETADTLIHLAPVYVLPDFLQRAPLAGLRRLLVFSTTSAVTKSRSSHPGEQALAARILEAEGFVQQYCARRRIPCTIFRPTMTYGLGMDNNVSFIARFIRRYGFFPRVGQGRGMRQPVHAADLATAAVAILENANTYNRIYDLGGGETVTYRVLVERIFAALGRRPLIIAVPALLLRAVVEGLRRWQRFEYLNPAMVDRMEQDMVFDISSAVADFGYAPRPFRPARHELIATKAATSALN
jgi:nucleoside-diphosphate-sugar epimerase